VDLVQQVYRRFYLSDTWVNQYDGKQPKWGPVGYLTYKTRYSRRKENGETEEYWETLRRVVEGVFQLQKDHVIENGLTWDDSRAQRTAKAMFEAMWKFKFLPPGRGLWMMGSDYVSNRTAAGLFNCAMISTEDIVLKGRDIYEFIMDALMLGVGVGFDTLGADKLKVKEPKESNGELTFIIPDSREGWVESLGLILSGYFVGSSIPVFDYSEIRKEGLPIKGFGGTSSGSKPLIELHKNIDKHLSERIGETLSSGDIVDLENYISKCVVAGNVRRSAALALGSPHDEEYITLKHDQDKLKSHRYGSNNSVACGIGMNYTHLVENTKKQGEPGYQWLENAKRYGRMGEVCEDSEIKGTNPCVSGDTLVYVADGRGNVPIKVLAEEGIDVPVFCYRDNEKLEVRYMRNPRITGYDQDIYRVTLDDGNFLDVTKDHKFLTNDRGYVKASELESGESLRILTKFEASIKDIFPKSNSNSQNYLWLNNGVTERNRTEHRPIIEFHKNISIARGSVVHHKDRNAQNNFPDNLEIMTKQDHDKLHGELIRGDNNPMRRARHEWSDEKWKQYHDNMSESVSGELNGRYSGVTNDELKEHAIILTHDLGRRFSRVEWTEYAKQNSLPQYFSGWREKHLGGILGLGKYAAAVCGFKTFSDKDPRSVRKYMQWTSEGYNCEFVGNNVKIIKTCEKCEKKLILTYSRREQSLCVKCGVLSSNSNDRHIANRRKGQHKAFKNRKETLRKDQLSVFTKVKFELGRQPLKSEWRKACKDVGVTPENARKGSPFTSWKGLVSAAETFNHRVVSVELVRKDTVYNGTVDEFHNFFVGGFASTKVNGKRKWLYLNNLQCGEIFLESSELCNLAEIFPANHDSYDEFKRTLKLAYLYCKTVTLTKTHWPETNARMLKNRRIGLGLGGVIQSFNRHGIRETLDWCDRGYGWIKKLDKQFSNWLCIPRSLKVTTVKPSGTVSLLSGATPGIHYPESEYYIRRITVSKESVLLPSIIEAGYTVRDYYTDPENTVVIDVPVKEPYFSKSKYDVTMWEQLENIAKMQEFWADNAVSNTTTFKKEEGDDIGRALELYEDRVKSLSFLPLGDHGYTDAPYEAITQEEYTEMSNKISELDFSGIIQENNEGLKEYCDSESCTIGG